ncbi:MAG: AMP-binding protein [Phormidesmis sp.]
MAAVGPGMIASCSVETVWQGLSPQWLAGDRPRTAAWIAQVSDRRRQLEDGSTLRSSRSLVLLAEADPVDFLAGFWAALLAGWDVAIANPHWGQQEWQSVSQLICPTVIWGEGAGQSQSWLAELSERDRIGSLGPTLSADSTILIPTSGSSGQVKFVSHRWQSLMASVTGFCQFFRPVGEPVNVYCVLPVYHVSGLMQVLRAWVSGGEATIVPFQRAVSKPPVLADSGGFISLVPTQLERLMQAGREDWLRRFQAVLLGGAPAWPTLLNRAADLRIPLCLSYGMTETAAMVTALSPQDFLQGDRSSGRALPHADIQTVRNAQPCAPEELGQIVVRIAALADPVYTDDLGYLSADGQLYITGRASSKIISGGENIFPAEVEAALRSTGQVKDVCVVGWPHPEWGEAVTALYVPADPTVSPESLRQALLTPKQESTTPTLSRYKLPKRWVRLPALPRNAQGKLNRRALLTHLQPRSSQPDQA